MMKILNLIVGELHKRALVENLWWEIFCGECLVETFWWESFARKSLVEIFSF